MKNVPMLLSLIRYKLQWLKVHVRFHRSDCKFTTHPDARDEGLEIYPSDISTCTVW